MVCILYQQHGSGDWWLLLGTGEFQTLKAFLFEETEMDLKCRGFCFQSASGAVYTDELLL